jgi:hypothetical protein
VLSGQPRRNIVGSQIGVATSTTLSVVDFTWVSARIRLKPHFQELSITSV